jgi:hypothetical protein
MECHQGGRLEHEFRIKIIKTGSKTFRRNPSNYLLVKIFSPMGKQGERKGEPCRGFVMWILQKGKRAALQVVTTGEITNKISI